MPPSGFKREKHMLTVGIVHLLDDRYVSLPRPGRVLQLMLTNLRNRPLIGRHTDSLGDCVLSLYHNLITGSQDFPFIPYRGNFRSRQQATPFEELDPERLENSPPSDHVQAPSAVMLPPAGSSPAPILTPLLPEHMEQGSPRADRRNIIRSVVMEEGTVTRVISPVFSSEDTKLSNRWRISHYRADGQVLMSVLCRFTRDSARCAKRQSRKRKEREGENLPSAAPYKRLRV